MSTLIAAMLHEWAMIRRYALVLAAACRGAPGGAAIDAAAPPAIDAADAIAIDAADAADVEASEASEASAPEGMIWVPAGTFTMGAGEGGEEDERPAHRVTLAGFFLDRTPVTNDAYAACVKAGACAPLGARDAKYTAPQHPVNTTSWDEARTYCVWRGARLPREAEYERAMRDDDGRTYAWGNDPPTAERATFGRPLKTGATDDVSTHPAGRGPYGHDDLAGNVWEWVEDEYDPYAYRRPTADRGVPGTCAEIMKTQDELRERGLQGFTGSNPIPHVCERVLRGGAFNYDGPGLRATNRVHHPAHFKLVMAGFRCAHD